MDRHRHQNTHTKQKHEGTDKKIIQAEQTRRTNKRTKTQRAKQADGQIKRMQNKPVSEKYLFVKDKDTIHLVHLPEYIVKYFYPAVNKNLHEIGLLRKTLKLNVSFAGHHMLISLTEKILF